MGLRMDIETAITLRLARQRLVPVLAQLFQCSCGNVFLDGLANDGFGGCSKQVRVTLVAIAQPGLCVK